MAFLRHYFICLNSKTNPPANVVLDEGLFSLVSIQFSYWNLRKLTHM